MQKPKCLIISNRGNRIFPSIYKMAGCKLKAYFFYYLQNGSTQTQSIIDLLVYRNQVQVKQAGDRSSTPLSSVTILLLTKLTWFRVNNTGNSTKSLPWILCPSLCTRSWQNSISEYLRTSLSEISFIYLNILVNPHLKLVSLILEYFTESRNPYLSSISDLPRGCLSRSRSVPTRSPGPPAASRDPAPKHPRRGAHGTWNKCFEFTRVVQSWDSRSHAVLRAA